MTATSRFLSYVLRHNPAAIGATLDDGGWISVEVLLAAAARHGRPVDRDTLHQLIDSAGKRRFEIRDGRIRAAQGHSIPVDLQLSPSEPPDLLYHGTVHRFLARIGVEGLRPGNRTHVHLSADPGAAIEVGARRGQPVVLVIAAGACTSADTSSDAPRTASGSPAMSRPSGSSRRARNRAARPCAKIQVT